jgi:hypothetical protein
VAARKPRTTEIAATIDSTADCTKRERIASGRRARSTRTSPGAVPSADLRYAMENRMNRAPACRARTTTRGKRSIAVDLTKDAGREVVRRLTADADVFAQNFRPGVGHHRAARRAPALRFSRLGDDRGLVPEAPGSSCAVARGRTCRHEIVQGCSPTHPCRTAPRLRLAPCVANLRREEPLRAVSSECRSRCRQEPIRSRSAN